MSPSVNHAKHKVSSWRSEPFGARQLTLCRYRRIWTTWKISCHGSINQVWVYACNRPDHIAQVVPGYWVLKTAVLYCLIKGQLKTQSEGVVVVLDWAGYLFLLDECECREVNCTVDEMCNLLQIVLSSSSNVNVAYGGTSSRKFFSLSPSMFKVHLSPVTQFWNCLQL